MAGARWILWATLTCAATAVAQEARTERGLQQPFLSDLAQVQDRGEIQARSGVEWDRGDPSAALRTPLELELGVTDRLEFEAGAELGVLGGAGSVDAGNAFAGIAYSPFDARDSGLAVSTGVGVALPFGALDPSTDYRAVPHVSAYKTLGPVAVNLLLEAEIPVLSRVGAPLDEPTVGAAISATYTRTGILHPVLEAAAYAGQDERAQVAAGVFAAPVEALQLGVAFVVTRDEAETSPGVFGNVIWSVSP